jgi:hypothetical protein
MRRCTATLWLSSIVVFWSSGRVQTVSFIVLDFENDFGAIANDNSAVTCAANSKLLAEVLNHSTNATSAIRLVAPNRTIYLHPGIVARQVYDAHLIVDGTLRFERPPDYVRHKKPLPCLMLVDSRNVTLTSTQQRDQRGLIDGQGSQYWGVSTAGGGSTIQRRKAVVLCSSTTTIVVNSFTIPFVVALGTGNWLFGVGRGPSASIQGRSDVRYPH